MRAPSDDVPDGTVLQEFRKGFRIGSTLLRPAMVQVSQPAAQVRHRCSAYASLPMPTGVKHGTLFIASCSIAAVQTRSTLRSPQLW